jgi:HK97 family phage major capsid protein
VDHISALLEERNRANKAARDIVDAALAEGRALSGEDREAIARADADFEAKNDMIAELRKIESRDAANAAALASAPEARIAAEMSEERSLTDSEIVRQLASGERRSYEFRAIATSTSNAPVPVSFYDVIQQNLIYTGPMLDARYFTRLDTDSGENITVPVESTRPSGTATAEAATLAQSDPTFGQLTLRAWKYTTLVVASRELIQDSGIDLIPFLGRQLGVALGTAVNSALTLGTGTVQPQGIAAAAGTTVQGGTGVAGVPTFDNLISLVHSVDTAYASRPAVAFMMRRATLGSVRILKDTAGNYLWSPASSVGTPDSILGYPVLENPYVAATGTGTKSVLFGDMSSFHVRTVGGIQIERSDEAYWTSDQVGFKARIRVDGALGQAGAVRAYQGGTA